MILTPEDRTVLRVPLGRPLTSRQQCVYAELLRATETIPETAAPWHLPHALRVLLWADERSRSAVNQAVQVAQHETLGRWIAALLGVLPPTTDALDLTTPAGVAGAAERALTTARTLAAAAAIEALEARLCPADVGIDEYVASLIAQRDAARELADAALADAATLRTALHAAVDQRACPAGGPRCDPLACDCLDTPLGDCDTTHDVLTAVLDAAPVDDWHEDLGPVVWWRIPVEEPPWVGTPLDEDWPGHHTHFTPILVPRGAAQDVGPRCEGCRAPATTEDAAGVDLCRDCLRSIPPTPEVTDVPA